AISKVLAGRTSFLIAHRLSTIKMADLILVVKDGKIIEQGTHAELIRRNGHYRELYSMQFEDELGARIARPNRSEPRLDGGAVR
ncbi:MAG: hypothetical protein LBF92_02660, partial [Synergistaceae bacterium]|nr:hypothetical protein [Synergistaceae bacterium]